MGIRLTATVISLIIAGCAGPVPASSSPSAAGEPAATIASTAPSASAVASTASETPGEVPPDASLAAEGGDPITAQLGTYTWRDTGSDSPWLRGAPIAIGAGEPLTVTLEPVIGVESWRARLVPATADGPAGAVILGQGPGPIAFTAPAPGAWTVEVAVTFADGLGDASYFWRFEVS
jgi:hypothetical protein